MMSIASAPIQGWHTSVGVNGKAHFYVDGEPSCGERKGIWPGGKLSDLFTRERRRSTDADHHCRYCSKVSPHVCKCWGCTMKAKGMR